MQRITLDRLYQVSGITDRYSARPPARWDNYRAAKRLHGFTSQPRTAIANATHLHGFPLDRLDPTCPQCM